MRTRKHLFQRSYTLSKMRNVINNNKKEQRVREEKTDKKVPDSTWIASEFLGNLVHNDEMSKNWLKPKSMPSIACTNGDVLGCQALIELWKVSVRALANGISMLEINCSFYICVTQYVANETHLRSLYHNLLNLNLN